jgi:hypothetical protein
MNLLSLVLLSLACLINDIIVAQQCLMTTKLGCFVIYYTIFM